MVDVSLVVMHCFSICYRQDKHSMKPRTITTMARNIKTLIYVLNYDLYLILNTPALQTLP